MRAIAIIPARYDSTRFKGKPLADLCGRPMLWWVYHQVKKPSVFRRCGWPQTTPPFRRPVWTIKFPAK